jgi:hypothetical protein
VNPIDDGELDRQLEEAVAPDGVTVERVVTGALSAQPARRLVRVRLVASLGAAVVLVALAVWNWPANSRPPDPIRMRNVGDVILVDFPDGSRAVIGPATSGPELFAGFDYVLVQGERQ